MIQALSAQNNQKLNSVFHNALISDVENNIERKQPIKIIAVDEKNKRIKTNYKDLKPLFKKGSNNIPWFITQSEEATTIVEIKAIDTNSGWITLGNTLSGFFNMDDGETLEFFNPFVNYDIINNKPLLKKYPNYINDQRINYIQAGGIIKRANDYVLLTPVVFGAHRKREIYYATSTNLEDWNFHPKQIITSNQIPFAKKDGNLFSTGNPLRLDKNKLLVLLGVELPNGLYTSAYMIINDQLKILQAPKEINIQNSGLITKNNFPLSITKFKGIYRLLIHQRDSNNLNTRIYEITTKHLFETLDLYKKVIATQCIHKADAASGYLRGKADDAAYVIFNSNLYILLGSEELPSEYLTSLNRQYGLLSLEGNTWQHDVRSPLIVNPMTIHHKFPEYEWAADHTGGFISPIINNGYLYLFLSFGTDNPDYLLSGIKVKLK